LFFVSFIARSVVLTHADRTHLHGIEHCSEELLQQLIRTDSVMAEECGDSADLIRDRRKATVAAIQRTLDELDQRRKQVKSGAGSGGSSNINDTVVENGTEQTASAHSTSANDEPSVFNNNNDNGDGDGDKQEATPASGTSTSIEPIVLD
jgi:hypothetical protein